jgi:hypothetical protein
VEEPRSNVTTVDSVMVTAACAAPASKHIEIRIRFILILEGGVAL